ncbi:hypothetical protein FEM48_Zijuj08G0199900 [Ziziphus jujuba var. spinosa]|uniref:Uncharacterized protein n=1 Tax=Ziziphus jujuba var. spinosa TaxID=714518 RepID=A0A978V132_ZIZJJ|nr:hypothetical protein FEM48_Zijuj08G0199900 [Ziziphus jujuba var. spinosa]
MSPAAVRAVAVGCDFLQICRSWGEQSNGTSGEANRGRTAEKSRFEDFRPLVGKRSDPDASVVRWPKMGQSAVAGGGGKKSPPIFERPIPARPATDRRENLRFCRKWGGEPCWPARV